MDNNTTNATTTNTMPSFSYPTLAQDASQSPTATAAPQTSPLPTNSNVSTEKLVNNVQQANAAPPPPPPDPVPTQAPPVTPTPSQPTPPVKDVPKAAPVAQPAPAPQPEPANSVSTEVTVNNAPPQQTPPPQPNVGTASVSEGNKDSKDKSPLQALAEKLNKFKDSIVEEVDEDGNVVDSKKDEVVVDTPTAKPAVATQQSTKVSLPDTSTPQPKETDVVDKPVTPEVPETPETSASLDQLLAEDHKDMVNKKVTPVAPPVDDLASKLPDKVPAVDTLPVVTAPTPPVADPVVETPVEIKETKVEEVKPEVSIIPDSTIKDIPPAVDKPMEVKETKIEDISQPVMDAMQTNVQGTDYPYTIYQLLDMVIEKGGSDLHLSVDYPGFIRLDGSLQPVAEVKLTSRIAEKLILEVLPDNKKELLEVNREVDLAYEHKGKARFRINAYYQQQTLAAAFRLIPSRIKTIDELQLPQIYHQLAKLRQGLVLVTGPTGSGKSTTLAAILQEVNLTRTDHIITIEDPIEYVFPKATALVDQRELHEDTHSWAIAMKSALRQDPDVVLVGEMRDYETISAAITLAETGHLVFATLHTNSASQTIDRVIDVFPEHQQSQVRSQLSNVIEAVIAQRLVPMEKGGRRAASEIMIATPAVRNLIREGKTHQLDNVIATSADIGMISIERSLVGLVRDGLITMERAQEYAVHPEEVVRLLKG